MNYDGIRAVLSFLDDLFSLTSLLYQEESLFYIMIVSLGFAGVVRLVYSLMTSGGD